MRLSGRRRDEELEEEIKGHLRMAVRERVERGETPEEAEAAARREFGNVTLVKEVTREMWGRTWLSQFRQDFVYGLRTMRRGPGFAAVAVIAIALGVGANTAIFSVVNAVLLRPLPFKDPSRLIMLWEDNTRLGFPRNTVSPANFADYRDQSRIFEGVAAFTPRSFNLTGEGEPERIDGMRVSANLLALLGVTPRLGRPFTSEEDRFGAGQVVILSDGLWHRRYGSDPSVIGRTIMLDGKGYTVVGVLPPGYQFRGAFPGAKDDLLVPLALRPGEAASRGSHYLDVVARLKDGITLEQARAETATIALGLQQQYPSYDSGIGAAVVPLQEQLVGDIKPALLVLLGAVGFVLLVACANVANLLLARASSRQKEIATRVALGASRARLVRQFLTESVVLAAVGGAFGLLLSVWGVRALKAFIPDNVSRAQEISIDVKVLAFTLFVSILTGLVFGLAPALQATKLNLNETLKEGGRDSSGGTRGNRMRAALVVAEIAVSFVLLVGAGLLVNSFVRLSRVDPGFDYENLLTMRIQLPQSKYPDLARRSAFYTELLRRVEGLPGVRSAAVTSPLPLIYNGDSMPVTIEGRPAPPPGQDPDIVTRVVSPHYFRAMGIRLLRGRELSDQDGPNSPPVAVISETMAGRYWPGEDPIGKRLAPGSAESHEDWVTIVGVANDVRQFELGSESKPQMYLSYEQSEDFVPRELVVKTEGEPLGLAAAVRGEVWGIDRDQPVSNVAAMRDLVAGSLARQRFSVLLLGLFAALALVLAAVGIYGVTSYTVAQRRHEIGIRMALGARPRDVLRLALGGGLRLVLVGVGVGLLAALGLTRLMAGLLYGVSAADPATYAAISAVLVCAAMLACLVPARRATKVDPLVALRAE